MRHCESPRELDKRTGRSSSEHALGLVLETSWPALHATCNVNVRIPNGRLALIVGQLAAVLQALLHAQEAV